MLDYEERPKKKKKHSKSSKESSIKAKPVRNFKIIDDDIGLSSCTANEENETMVDLIDGSDAPIIVTDLKEFQQEELKVVKKVDYFSNNKWVKVDVCENEDGDMVIPKSSKGLFKKRKESKAKSNKNNDDSDLEIERNKPTRNDSDSDLDLPRPGSNKNGSDSDLDLPRRGKNRNDSDSDLDIPRQRKTRKDSDSDLDSVPRKQKIKKEYSDDDMSPLRVSKLEEEIIDETKCRVKKKSKLEILKEEEATRKKEEKLMKYMEWGKGLVQKKDREEQLESDLYEADKPLARYKDDKDLDKRLMNIEREDDPMAEYIRNKTASEEHPGIKKPSKPKYRGPPAAPNRYGILPGSRWDGVDRSNGFEKRFYDSINAKKARDEEAYKWSVEDM